MGLDFIRKAAKSFDKGLDQSLVELATPGLFTVQPDCRPRTYAAAICSGKELSCGEELNIRLSDGKVVAQKGIDTVAEIDSPPRDLVEALVKSYGVAQGKVQEVYEMADTAEIAVC